MIILIMLIIVLVALMIILRKNISVYKFLEVLLGIILVAGFVFVLIVFGLKKIENNSSIEKVIVPIENNKSDNNVSIDTHKLKEQAIKDIKIDFNYFVKSIGYSMMKPEDNGPVVVNARFFNYSNILVEKIAVKYKLEDCKPDSCITVDEGTVKIIKEIPINQARDVRFSIGQNKNVVIYGTLKVSLDIDKINQ